MNGLGSTTLTPDEFRAASALATAVSFAHMGITTIGTPPIRSRWASSNAMKSSIAASMIGASPATAGDGIPTAYRSRTTWSSTIRYFPGQ
jgi:hypothetical protein